MAAKWYAPNKWGIYRNIQEGWIAGVCAGIADRLAIKPIWVRLALIAVACATKIVPGIILYAILAFTLKARTAGVMQSAAYVSPLPASFNNLSAAAATPSAGPRLGEIKSRFSALDARLNRIEAAVMSDEISLRRKFRDLGG